MMTVWCTLDDSLSIITFKTSVIIIAITAHPDWCLCTSDDVEHSSRLFHEARVQSRSESVTVAGVRCVADEKSFMIIHLAWKNVSRCSGLLLGDVRGQPERGRINPLKRDISPPTVEEDTFPSVIRFSQLHVKWDKDEFWEGKTKSEWNKRERES